MKRTFILTVAVIFLFGMLTACGQKEAEPISDLITEGIEETEYDSAEDKTEVLEEEEKISQDLEQEPSEISETAGTMEDWLTETGLNGMCVAVWNDNNATGYIIEEGENYNEVEEDRYFVCTPSMMIEMNSFTTSGYNLGKPTDNYCEIFFGDFKDENVVEFKITCKNGEEKNINFFITKPHEQTGYEWTKSLGYEEPVMVVWNDTTGLRKELEEGETYQLMQDDMVAMYIPEQYGFYGSSIDGNVLFESDIAMLRWNLLDLGEQFDFGLSIMHHETFDIVTLHNTLLPPIE